MVKTSKLIKEKVKLAQKIISRCSTKHGFQASAQLYGGTYWTRDFCYSLYSLMKLGYFDLIKRQLQDILDRQYKTGSLPTVYMRWFSANYLKALVYRLVKFFTNPSAVLHLEFYFHTQRHPWTADNELLFLIAFHQYVGRTKDFQFAKRNRSKIKKLQKYVDSVLENGLIRGADWRDAMHNYTDKFVFCNQVLLYYAYKSCGRLEDADRVKKRINKEFWDEKFGHYQDFLGSSKFDSLGHSLALLWGVVPKGRTKKILKSLSKASTQYGYKNIAPPYEQTECSQEKSTFHNSTIWPFVHGYVVLALLKIKKFKEARRELLKFSRLKGLAEWYDPRNGKIGGSKEQLWTAALYLHAYYYAILRTKL